MRHNQKYSKEEMYSYIEMWKSGSCTQQEICDRIGLSKTTIKYWHKKYEQEKRHHETAGTFLPISISSSLIQKQEIEKRPVEVEISYPNGAKLKCSSAIGISKLQSLLNI